MTVLASWDRTGLWLWVDSHPRRDVRLSGLRAYLWPLTVFEAHLLLP